MKQQYTLAFIVNILLMFYSSLSLANQSITLSVQQQKNLNIQVSQAVRVNSVPLLTAPATVIIPPNNDYIVSTLQAGLLQKIEVSIGDNVKKGDILARINSPQLLDIQQQYLKAVNQLHLATANFIRDKQLFKEGVIADRRWLKTQAQQHMLRSSVNEKKQLLVLSGLSKTAIKRLKSTHILSSTVLITSPISGVILERFVRSGQKAEALSALFRVANIDQLWLDINIPQQRVHQLQVGNQVIINNMLGDSAIFLIGQQVNPENQTVLARAKLPKKQRILTIGQTLSVQINKIPVKAALKVPNSTLAKIEGRMHVFIKTPTGFKTQIIQVIGREGIYSIIEGNLSIQDKIAVKGVIALKAQLLGLGGDE